MTFRGCRRRLGIAHRGLAVCSALSLVIGLGACGASGAEPSIAGETISVLGSWTDQELTAFNAVLAPFEQRTGAKVAYTATRDLTGVLRRDVTAGRPPDVAGLAGPADMAALARDGILKELSTAIDLGSYKAATAPTFVELGTVDGRLVGVFIRASVKGLIWYSRATINQAMPRTWDDLRRLIDATLAQPSLAGTTTRAWCVGLASHESSGWPGTDWIEDFLLRQSGPEAYDAWIAGTLQWTSPEVRRAFMSYGQIVAEAAVHGGSRGALTTYFTDSGNPLFTDPPGCLFLHQASFMTTFLDAAAKPPPKYDFIPFPDIDPRFAGSLIVAGDLFGMLHDTPAARALIQYLVTAEAQAIWVERGGALSGNFNVHSYPNAIAQREAALLAGARIPRFDASDSMPDDMSAAFWQAVLDFTADQSRLDTILEQLEAVRRDAYKP